MKLDIRIENGKPILFFLDIDVDSKNNLIQCFNYAEMHTQATRAYMRSLKKPTSKSDLIESFKLLEYYSNEFIKYS